MANTPPRTPQTSASRAKAQAILTQSKRNIQARLVHRQATMSAQAIFTDGETPLLTKRTEADIAQLGVTVDKKKREDLKKSDAKTYQRIQERR